MMGDLRDLHSFPTRRSSDLVQHEVHEPQPAALAGRRHVFEQAQPLAALERQCRALLGRIRTATQRRTEGHPAGIEPGGRRAPGIHRAHHSRRDPRLADRQRAAGCHAGGEQPGEHALRRSRKRGILPARGGPLGHARALDVVLMPDLISYIPIATTTVALVFSAVLFRRWRERGGLHLMWWGLGALTFAAGTITESLTTLTGWHEGVFRAWYI